MLRTVLNRSPNLFFANFPCFLEIVDSWKWNYSLLRQTYEALQKMKDFSEVSFKCSLLKMDHLFRVRRVEYTIILIFIYILNTAIHLGVRCMWHIVGRISKLICARQLYSAHISFITIPTVPILFFNQTSYSDLFLHYIFHVDYYILAPFHGTEHPLVVQNRHEQY